MLIWGVQKWPKKAKKSKNTNCTKPWIHWAAKLSEVHLFRQQNTSRSKLCIACSDFFCKSQSTLTPLLLLSKSNPLRWASIWFWVQAWNLLASILLRYSKNRQAPLAACRFWFIHASVYPKSNEISRATILPQGIASWSEWLPASILRTPHRDQALVRNESTGDYIQSQRAYSSNPDRILPFISPLFHGTKYALQTQCILSENGGID